MSDKLKTWPERIWLQHSEDGYPVPTYKVETDEITWCEHQQFDSDIEYVRADRIAELERQVAELRKNDERYRLIRDTRCSINYRGKRGQRVGLQIGLLAEYELHGSLDEAIDAELAQAKTEG